MPLLSGPWIPPKSTPLQSLTSVLQPSIGVCMVFSEHVGQTKPFFSCVLYLECL